MYTRTSMYLILTVALHTQKQQSLSATLAANCDGNITSLQQYHLQSTHNIMTMTTSSLGSQDQEWGCSLFRRVPT